MYYRYSETTKSCSPLHLAAKTGDLNAVKAELTKGVNLEDYHKEPTGYNYDTYYTPLALAVRYSHAKVVELLLSAGSALILKKANLYYQSEVHYVQDVQLVDTKKKNIIAEKKELLREAIKNGDMANIIQFSKQNLEWFEIPIAETTKHQQRNSHPRQTTALHFAAEFDQPEILDFIAERLAAHRGTSKKSILETCNHNNCAPLHYAIYGNAANVVQYLLNQNVNCKQIDRIDVKTQGNQKDSYEAYGSPLHLAIYLGRKKIIDLLANVSGLLNLTAEKSIGNYPEWRTITLTLAQVNPCDDKKNYLVTKIETLIEAIKSGDVLTIAEFSLANIDWLTLELNGRTTLQIATENNQVNALDFIAAELAQHRKVSKEKILSEHCAGVTLLAIAVAAGHENIVKYLLADNKIDINQKSLQYSIRHGYTLHDVTALAVATRLGKHSMVELLLTAGADVNILCGNNDEIYTALNCAIATTKRELVVLLLQNHASVHVSATDDKKSNSSLALATYLALDDIIDLLLAAGVKIEPQFLKILPTKSENLKPFFPNYNHTLSNEMKNNGLYQRLIQLLKAIERGDLDTVKAFVSQNASWLTLTSPETKLTPLVVAIQYGQIDILNFIASEIAQLTDLTKTQVLSQAVAPKRMSPLCYAIQYDQQEVIYYLRRAGVSLNPSSKYLSVPPLSRAAYHNNADVIDTLLTLGADLTCQYEDKRLPHQITTHDNKPSVLKAYVIEFCHALRTGDINIVSARIKENNSWLRLVLNQANQTAWHIAAKSNQRQLLSIMIETTIMSRHLSPEEYAKYRSSKILPGVKIKDYLTSKINRIREEARIPELDEADGLGLTPLQYCAFNKEPDIFALLSDHSTQHHESCESVYHLMMARIAGYNLEELCSLNKHYPASIRVLEEPVIRERFTTADEVVNYLQHVPLAADLLLGDLRLCHLIKVDVKAIAKLIMSLPINQLQKHHNLLLKYMTRSQCSKAQTIAAKVSDRYQNHISPDQVALFLDTQLGKTHLTPAGMLVRGYIAHRGFFHQPQDLTKAKQYYQSVLRTSEMKEAIQALFELANLYNAEGRAEQRDDAINELLNLCECYLNDEADHDAVIDIQRDTLTLQRCFGSKIT